MEIWNKRPNDEQIKVRINEFMTALAAADLQKAFQICPCTEFKTSDHDAMFEYLEHAMYQFIVEGGDEDDGDEEDDGDDEDDEDDDDGEGGSAEGKEAGKTGETADKGGDEEEDDEDDEDEDDNDEDDDDESDDDEGAELTKPATWLSGITPPAELEYEDLELEVDDDEVIANVYLDGEVTDIACRYRLKEKKGTWHLYFENFDIL